MPELTGQRTISQQLEQSCAEEPIHIIGTVQPHGFVLVVDIDSTRIVQVSSGAARHWPGLRSASRLLRHKVEHWIDGFAPDVATVFAALPSSDPAALPLTPRLAAQPLSAGERDRPPTVFECVGHRVGGVAVLEWQPSSDDADPRAGGARFIEGITSALAGLRRAQTLEAFFTDCVHEVARLSGFDRVMLYRFLPDWTGEVIAEKAAANLTTRFLGLRFPASDIPSQARALYTASKIRVLADVKAVPDTLLPLRMPDGEALDQGHSLLRGFSDVHRTYLDNMGVQATMSLSIVYDGTLWGLIACHHYRPKTPPHHVRHAMRDLCELVAEMVAMRIQIVRDEEKLRGASAMLEGRVADRTSELESLNRTLVQDSARSAIAADAAGLGFWNFDVAAASMQWDERMFRLYGLSPLEGDTHALWTRSLHPDDRKACERDLFDAINGNCDYDSEFRIVHPNGAIRHLKAAGRVTRDAAGNPIRMFGVNFDITERKRADEQFRLAIEAAPTGMLLTDLTGSIVLVNAQIEKLFGYPRRDLLGMPVELLVPHRFRADHPDLGRGFYDAPSARAMGAGVELTGVCKDGSEVPLEVALTPFQTSKGEFVLCSVVDLTQRREIERMRSDFVSTVSHELRTPLTSIGASLSLLLSGGMGPLPEDATAMVTIAHKNSDRLMRIINDILDIGGLESDGFTLQMSNASVVDLIAQSIEANAAFAQKFAVRFKFEEKPTDDRILVDPDRFIQVITNLLSNAAKYSPPGAEVLIRVRTGPTSNRIEVEDFGSGVPESFQGRIFQRFAQADASPRRRFAGTGLGLSIARKLVEAMGGTIGFHSVGGQGSVFYIELPRVNLTPPGRRDPPPATAAAPAAPAAPRILYVEDDDHVISLIRATLGERATVVGAHTLEEAEELLRGRNFALLLLDQFLPDGTGLSLIDRIPEILGESVPILILSSADIPHALHRKVAAVLIKSGVSAAQIATTILSYLPLPSPDTALHLTLPLA